MMDYLLKNKGGFLFCEMRTGKTLGAILYMIKHKKVPILIVAPCMAMANWYKWLIAQGFNKSMISMVEGTKKKRDKELARNCPIVICNYEMSLRYKMKKVQSWKVVLFDESYRMANINASVTRYWIRGERPDDQVRIAITGDPAPESPLNFATQCFIIQNTFMGYDSYNDYYMDNWQKNPYSGKDEPQRKSHIYRIEEYIKKVAHCVTMKSLGMGSEILRDTVKFDMNGKQKKWMKEVFKLREIAKMFQGADPSMNPHRLRAQNLERKIAAGIDPETGEMFNMSKIKHIVESYLEAPEPIVVFSIYKAPLFAIQKAFEDKGVKVGLIWGSSGTPSQKEAVKDQFLAGEFDVLLGQTKSVQENYDFSIASKTFYLTNGYSRNTRSQSEKRTTNIEKKIPVEIIDLCTEGTMDEVLVEKLKTKGKISYQFIDTEMDKLVDYQMAA